MNLREGKKLEEKNVNVCLRLFGLKKHFLYY